MSTPTADRRSAQQRQLDEQIAAEPMLSPPDLPSGAAPTPVEQHLHKLRARPQAYLGVVENGVIRLLDADVRLPERSNVIVVAQGMP